MNSFNLKLPLKDSESAIKNKLINSLSELQSDNQNDIAPFIRTQRQTQLLKKVVLMKYLNQSIVLLYQTYKNL